MDLGLYIAASGMVAEQTRQAQLSNDLANASTPGYKAEQSPQHSFGELLLSNTSTGQTVGSMNTGVQLGKSVIDLAPAGMQSDRPAARLRDRRHGLLCGADLPGGPLHPRRPVHRPPPQGSSWTAPGTPCSASPAPRSGLAPKAPCPPARSVSSTFPARPSRAKTFTRGTPSGHAAGTVRSGVLEESGVNPARTMVDMIGSLRTFQSGQQAIQAIDQTLQAASTQVGSLDGSTTSEE